MYIMQGDSYGIAFTIKIQNEIKTQDDFEDVEILIGELSKRLALQELKYDSENQTFVFPLTQQETLNLPANAQRAQVRCKLKNGDVLGSIIGSIIITASKSKVVL